MTFNKTTEYALTILGFMATRDEQNYSAEYLYQQLKIPRRYLRRLLTDLTRHGFLKSSAGRRGGFEFAMPLKDINLALVVEKLEDTGLKVNCILGFSCCIVNKPCIMHHQWVEACSGMHQALQNTHLAGLRENYLEDRRNCIS